MAATGTFWARRKAAVEAEAAAEVAAERAKAEAAEAATRAAEQAEMTEAELLEDLGLPDPDLMKMGDDFSAFMGRAVPEHLRRRALRKLWVSNPVLANLDGLLDHGEDYTDAATVIPGMQTGYQVGKGMLSHLTALAEQAAANDDLEGEETKDPIVAEVDFSEAEDGMDDMAEDSVLIDYSDKAPEDEVAVEARPRRHMRFEFSS